MRAHDKAQREALALARAERDRVISLLKRRDGADTQLGEAKELLKKLQPWMARLAEKNGYGIDGNFEELEEAVLLNAFLARNTSSMAEQPEAKGAQGTELEDAVRVLLEAPQLQGEQAFSARPIIERVRAALATRSDIQDVH
ncbi:hypothetical protein [Pseudomonas oryzihabitans]|uniref:hypothetical protein n=1 Tax=Pseudomonas oryzihabitans TaxID=47885 RepID=UPI00289578CF|nr:hypothetical protein [Pseudomonas oryzihabitans]MDT3723266.1 hypothetical protein [Pseudomonas oryzihabitans]